MCTGMHIVLLAGIDLYTLDLDKTTIDLEYYNFLH